MAIHDATYKALAAILDQDNLTPAQIAICEMCTEVRDMLLRKNKAYGNSALAPLRVFSRATPLEGMLVRMDDKLSRIKNAIESGGGDHEDPFLDLTGYLILFLIKRRELIGPASLAGREHPTRNDHPRTGAPPPSLPSPHFDRTDLR